MAKVNVDGCFDKFGGQGKEGVGGQKAVYMLKKHLSVCLTKRISVYFCTERIKFMQNIRTQEDKDDDSL